MRARHTAIMKRRLPVAACSLLAGVAGRRKLEGVNKPNSGAVTARGEPGRMSSVARPAGPVHVGLDTSKNTIMAAMLCRRRVPGTERIINDGPSVRRLFGRLTDKTGGRECLRC